MLAKAISCIGLYDPDSLSISQHYKAGKVLGKGQYGTVRGCTLTRGAKRHASRAPRRVHRSTLSMTENRTPKSHAHPVGLSLKSIESASTAASVWPSPTQHGVEVQKNYDVALRELVAKMTPGWRAQMRRENSDENGAFAYKVLEKERTGSKGIFLELCALATLRHDHILSLVEAFQDPENFYFVTNRCYGDWNTVWVMNGRPAPIGYIHKAAAQLLGALAHVHAWRFAHRDVKPANVFFKAPGDLLADICLGDFGMTVPVDALEGEEISGSPAFFGKEVWVEGRQAASSDVFAAGLTLLAIFKGEYPVALEDYLHVVPEPLRDEFAPPRNAWKRHETLAFGDQRLTAKMLRMHCPRDVEKRITLAIVASILSSREVMHDCITKAGAEDPAIRDTFRLLLEPDCKDRATASEGCERLKAMLPWGGSPFAQGAADRASTTSSSSSLPRRLGSLLPGRRTVAEVTGSGGAGAVCRRRLGSAGVCDTRDVALDASVPFSPLPRLLTGPSSDPWNDGDSKRDSKDSCMSERYAYQSPCPPPRH